MKKKTLLFLIILLLGFNLSIYGQETNLLLNGGFEEGFTVWAPDTWRDGSTLQVNDEKVHSGNQALVISTPSQTNDARAIQKVLVKPDTFYRLSGWIATENVTAGKTGANICLMEGFNHAGNITGTSEYQYVEFNFKTSSGHTEVTVGARLGMYGNDVTGKAWFDDLFLVKLDSEPESYKALEPPKSAGDESSGSQGETQVSQADAGTTIFWIIVGIAGVGIIVLLVFLDLKLLKKKSAKKTEQEDTDTEMDEETEADEDDGTTEEDRGPDSQE
ncbi:MAG: hypothetical protein JW969_18510 [Spirochaetales bacterium]|nr:hypothetical protein [Spirochaetales bacterium]